MPTTSTPARKKPAATRKAPTRAPDALKLLMADHKEVKTLFQAYEKLVQAEAEGSKKQAIAQQICTALTVHATAEEELLYPAAHEVLTEDDLVDEATVEHASAKELISQIESMQPSDELYDAKVKVLGEYIDHHVKEEEKEMFPKLRKTELDLKELGASIQARKAELLADIEAVH
jgi:hemerythrin superfamily protein